MSDNEQQVITTGQRIRAARKKNGESLATVAARAGLTIAQLCRIERDQVEATVPTLRKIGKSLRVHWKRLVAE